VAAVVKQKSALSVLLSEEENIPRKLQYFRMQKYAKEAIFYRRKLPYTTIPTFKNQ
jgi:hypothetical protein